MNGGDTGDDSRPQRVLHRLEETVLVLLMAALVGLACAQILLRNVLGITWLWGEPLLRHLVLWSSFAGALIATRNAAHIRIDAVLRLLPSPWRRRCAAVGDLTAAVVCAILTHAAVRFVLDERAYGDQAFLGLPRWTLQLVFPAAFAGMALRFAGRAAAGLRPQTRRLGPRVCAALASARGRHGQEP